MYAHMLPLSLPFLLVFVLSLSFDVSGCLPPPLPPHGLVCSTSVRPVSKKVWDLLRGDLVKFARRQLRRTVVEDTLNRAVDAFLKRQQERQEAERQEQLRRAERLKAEQLERLRQSQLQLQRDLKPRLEDGIDNAAAKASAVQPGMPAASDAPDLKSRVFSIKIERHPGAPLRRPLAADEAATAADMSSPKKPAASARRSSIEEPRGMWKGREERCSKQTRAHACTGDIAEFHSLSRIITGLYRVSYTQDAHTPSRTHTRTQTHTIVHYNTHRFTTLSSAYPFFSFLKKHPMSSSTNS